MSVDSPEQVALDYLWPYREKWVCPADIMKLTPDEFQGWHIEIKGKVMRLSRGGEAHTFSLKKLIVQLEKEMKRFPEHAVPTPRDLAKLLIHTSVERHNTLESIVHGCQGVGWYGYSVSVGGYIRGKRISGWHIVVDEFEGENCVHVFDLKEIYHEIEQDLKRGYELVQPTLF